MNRIAKRAWALVALMALLIGGTGFFLAEYMMNASRWVSHTGSPHFSAGSGLNRGTVVDRDGVLLMSMGKETAYAESKNLRKSTLHWLGDRQGKVLSTVINNYAGRMSNYDLFNGLYNYSDAHGTIELTLSAEVQKTALKAMGDNQGVIAVYNYKTGQILCSVTTPTYDPNDPPKLTEEELNSNEAYDGLYWNRFTRSTYSPGSIFKVATTAAALESIGDIQEQTFQCTGRVEYGPDAVTCEKVHGNVTLKQALAKSCNCAFAQIAQQLGKNKLEKYMSQFGVAKSLSFDGVNTRAGNFDLKGAADVEMAWAAIGQHTDLINPASYMTFLGTIAGGGTAAEPYVVSKVTSGEKTVYEARTNMTAKTMSAETAQILTDLMANNVEVSYGSSNFPGLTVCAKSGTSQVGGEKTSNALFAGFVADEAYPLAFIVVVENGGYGASTCVPILSKVLAACKAELDSY